MLSRRCSLSVAACFPYQSSSQRSLHTVARNIPDHSLSSILVTQRMNSRHLQQHTPLTSFDILVEDLCTLLSRYSGRQASEIDHKELQIRMQKYQTNRAEWARYALEDSETSYTRNLVNRPGGWASLVRVQKMTLTSGSTVLI